MNDQSPARWRLRRARIKRGWGYGQAVEHIAQTASIKGIPPELLDLDESQLKRWEAGKNTPRKLSIWLLSETYRLPAEQLDLPPLTVRLPSLPPRSAQAHHASLTYDDAPDVLATGGDDQSNEFDVKRRQFAKGLIGIGSLIGLADAERVADALKHASRVDPNVLADLEQLTADHESRLSMLPPAYHLVRVRSHLSILRELASTAPDESARHLNSLASRTATVAAWCCGQIDNRGDAMLFSRVSVEHAAAANDSEAHARALIYRSSLHSQVPHAYWQANSRYTLLLLDQSASLLGSQSPPLLLAWLFAWRAVEQAAVGDSDQCHRDLDRAYRCLAQRRARDIGLVHDWDDLRLDAYRGNCAVALQHTSNAIVILEQVAQRCDGSLSSRRSAVLGDLAIAYATEGQIDQAAVVLGRYLGHALDGQIPARIQRALRVRRHLDRWRDHAAVRNLDEQFNVALDVLG